MSKKKQNPTIITITLPPQDGIQRSGQLLIQRGDLAQLCQFHYTNMTDIASALKDAQLALVTLERNPPSIGSNATQQTPAASNPADDEPAELKADEADAEPAETAADEPASDDDICLTCGGSGQVTTVSTVAGTRIETSGVCLDCEGSGHRLSDTDDAPDADPPAQPTLLI